MAIRWTEEEYRIYRETLAHAKAAKLNTSKHAPLASSAQQRDEPKVQAPQDVSKIPPVGLTHPPEHSKSLLKALAQKSPTMTRKKAHGKDQPTQHSQTGDVGMGGLAQSLIALGLGDKVAKSKTKTKTKKKIQAQEDVQALSKENEAVGEDKPKEKKKKRGVEVAPIFQSLITSNAVSAWGDDWLAIDMPGARVLTYNEMFSILQYRKFEAFRYKKLCRELIRRAVKNTSSKTPVPFFDGPTRLTLLRVGTREMDRDALPVVFKYFLDTLKREKKQKEGEENPNIIDDDNPNIIVDIVTLQDKGEPRLAMLLEKIPDWNKTKAPSWKDWMNERSPTPPALGSTPKKSSSKKKANKKPPR